jgi:Protein of unknown function (DUF1236)
MSKSLLATIAAAGLVAGTIAVSAQGTQSPGSGSAPAEKMDRGSPGEERGSPRQEDQKASPRREGQKATPEREGQKATPQQEGQKATPQQEGQKATPQREGQKATPEREGQKATPQREGQKATPEREGQKAPPEQEGQKAAPQREGATQEGRTGGAGAELSTEQRTQVRQTILQSGNVPRVSRSEVNINISVGTVVPRSVRLVSLPERIVTIRPAWRGFLYFVVEDEIIVVEPGSLKIVAVISA